MVGIYQCGALSHSPCSHDMRTTVRQPSFRAPMASTARATPVWRKDAVESGQVHTQPWHQRSDFLKLVFELHGHCLNHGGQLKIIAALMPTVCWLRRVR